jgi:protein gp37
MEQEVSVMMHNKYQRQLIVKMWICMTQIKRYCERIVTKYEGRRREVLREILEYMMARRIQRWFKVNYIEIKRGG